SYRWVVCSSPLLGRAGHATTERQCASRQLAAATKSTGRCDPTTHSDVRTFTASCRDVSRPCLLEVCHAHPAALVNPRVLAARDRPLCLLWRVPTDMVPIPRSAVDRLPRERSASSGEGRRTTCGTLGCAQRKCRCEIEDLYALAGKEGLRAG